MACMKLLNQIGTIVIAGWAMAVPAAMIAPLPLSRSMPETLGMIGAFSLAFASVGIALGIISLIIVRRRSSRPLRIALMTAALINIALFAQTSHMNAGIKAGIVGA